MIRSARVKIIAAIIAFIAVHQLFIISVDNESLYTLNPGARFRMESAEASFMIVDAERALDIFRNSDYDDCMRIAGEQEILTVMAFVEGDTVMLSHMVEETRRTMSLVTEVFNHPFPKERFEDLLDRSRGQIKELNRVLRTLWEITDRLSEKDASPGIPEKLAAIDSWLRENGFMYQLGHVKSLTADYYFTVGEDTRALSYLLEALDHYKACGYKAALSQEAGRLGEYYRRKGALDEAEEALILSLDTAREMRDSYYTGRALSFLGSLRKDAGYFFEAESLYTESLACCRSYGKAPCLMMRHLMLGELCFDLGELERAEYHLAEVVYEAKRIARGISIISDRYDAHFRIGIRYSLSSASCILARINLERGKSEEAVRTMLEAMPMADKLMDRRKAADMEAILGEAYEAAGRHNLAEKHLGEAIRISRKLGEPKEIAKRLVSVSKIHKSQGKHGKAEKALSEAIQIAERSGDWPIVCEALALSASIRSEVRDPHGAYGLLERAAGLFEKEYVAIEAPAGRKAMKSLRHEIYSGIFNLLADSACGTDSLTLWAERYREGLPGAPERPSEVPASSRARLLHALRRMPEGAAVLEYLVTPSRLIIVATDSSGSSCTTVDIDETGLRSMAARFLSICHPQCTADPPPAKMQQEKDFLSEASSLYSILIRPVEGVIEGKKDLYVIPDGILFNLPFHVLVERTEDPRFLTEDYRITRASNLARLSAGADTGGAVRNRQTAFDDPLLLATWDSQEFVTRIFPHVRNLHHTLREIEAVREMIGGCTILKGHDATKQAFLSLAGGADMIHIATHTVNYPLYSDETALVLASAMEITGEKELPSALLRPCEISSLDLDSTRLVVLATCESACGRAGSADGTPGLADAFISAGAEYVLASLWPLDDRLSAEFIPVFLSSFGRTGNPSAALQEAQIGAISRARANGNAASGFQEWTPFVLIGTMNSSEPDRPAEKNPASASDFLKLKPRS